jgi:hypothetical protein
VRRLAALDVFLTSWEAEHGALTAEDMAAAAANLHNRQTG